MRWQVRSSEDALRGFLGDLEGLAEQLVGTTVFEFKRCGGPVPIRLEQVHDLSSLRRFLKVYREHILLPIEMGAIIEASEYAGRNAVTELVELDLRLAAEPLVKVFAAASQLIGRSHLARLRPLKDCRVVRRFDQAVVSGKAYGWHPLVYGVMLSVFSLPLREGLLRYAVQSLRTYVIAASREVAFGGHLVQRMNQEIVLEAQAASETAIRREDRMGVRVV